MRHIQSLYSCTFSVEALESSPELASDKKKGYHSTHFKIFKVKDNKQINNIEKNFWKTQWQKTSSNHYRNQEDSKQNSKDNGTNWIKDSQLPFWTPFYTIKTTLANSAECSTAWKYWPLYRVNTPLLSLCKAASGRIFATVKLWSGRKVAAAKLTSVKAR